MSRHRSQDPEGSAARRFAAWLRRDPEHRQRALRRRMGTQYQDSEDVGMLAVVLLLLAILGLAAMRLYFGHLWPL